MRFSFFSNLWSFWEVGWICKKVLQKSQEFAGLNSTKKGLYVAPSKKKGSFATYFGQIKGGEPTRQLLYDDFNDKNLIFYEGPQTTFEEAKKNLLGPPWFYPKTTTRHKNQRHLEVLEGSNVMTMTRQLVYQILNDKNSIFNKCSQNRILKPWEFFIWPLTKKASFVTFFGQIKGRSLWMSTWRVIKGERYCPLTHGGGGGGDRHLGSRYHIFHHRKNVSWKGGRLQIPAIYHIFHQFFHRKHVSWKG